MATEGELGFRIRRGPLRAVPFSCTGGGKPLVAVLDMFTVLAQAYSCTVRAIAPRQELSGVGGRGIVFAICLPIYP